MYQQYKLNDYLEWKQRKTGGHLRIKYVLFTSKK